MVVLRNIFGHPFKRRCSLKKTFIIRGAQLLFAIDSLSLLSRRVDWEEGRANHLPESMVDPIRVSVLHEIVQERFGIDYRELVQEFNSMITEFEALACVLEDTPSLAHQEFNV
jgi:hypothetical protein